MNLTPKGENRRYGWDAALLGASLSSIVFALYLRTLAPTVLDFDPPEIFDSPMLQAAASVLGIGHPTGYPTYMMVTHLFTYLPFGDIAYRVNLTSAVFGTLAVLSVYLVGIRLSGRAVAAAAGALAFGLSPTFWGQATIAEVYTLNALFVALVLLALLLWRESRRDRYLLLAAFLTGLSLTHHLTSIILIPAWLAFVLLVERRKLSDLTLLFKGAGLFLAGLTPYLYLPIRAAMEAPLNEADPSSPGRFLLLITGGSFLLKNFTDAGANNAEGPPGRVQYLLDGLLTRLPDYWGYLADQFPAVLAVVGVFGTLYLISTDRATAILLGVPLVGSLLHGLLYGFEDYYLFLIPAYLIFGLMVAVGLAALLRAAEGPASRLSRAPRRVLLISLSALALASPFIGVGKTYAAEDRSEYYGGRRTIEAVAEQVEPGATVVHHRSSLWYMVLVEQRRRDLRLIDPFETSWVRYNDIVWPDPLDSSGAAVRYGTDDTTGLRTAREVAKMGPVYVLDPDREYVPRFRQAGFDAVRVDEDVGLYRLVDSSLEGSSSRRPGREPARL